MGERDADSGGDEWILEVKNNLGPERSGRV